MCISTCTALSLQDAPLLLQLLRQLLGCNLRVHTTSRELTSSCPGCVSPKAAQPAPVTSAAPADQVLPTHLLLSLPLHELEPLVLGQLAGGQVHPGLTGLGAVRWERGAGAGAGSWKQEEQESEYGGRSLQGPRAWGRRSWFSRQQGQGTE